MSGPIATGTEPARHPREPGPSLPTAAQSVRAAMMIVVIFVTAGAFGGLFWGLTTDPVPYIVAPDGAPVEANPFVAFDDDARFAVVGLVGGLVVGGLVAGIFRRYGVWMVLASLVGSCVAPVLALAVGYLVGPGTVFDLAEGAEPGTVFGALSVVTVGVLAMWPVGALATIIPILAAVWSPNDPTASARVRFPGAGAATETQALDVAHLDQVAGTSQSDVNSVTPVDSGQQRTPSEP